MKDERKMGFMIGIGLLLEHPDVTFNTTLKGILDSYGQDLHLEIEDEEHARTADDQSVKPCPIGYIWDHEKGECVVPT